MQITKTADQDTTTWTISVDGAEVSWLSIWTANGEICDVSTRSGHQGNGYASALYRHADTEYGIFHTIPAHRSEDGYAFAARVGGDTIDEDDAVVVDVCCCDHCAALAWDGCPDDPITDPADREDH